MDSEKKEIQKGIKWIDEDKIEVKTKQGIFILEDISAAEMEKASKIAQKKNGLDKMLLTRILISKMIIEPKEFSNSDADIFNKLKMSSFVRLTKAVDYLIDADGDFL